MAGLLNTGCWMLATGLTAQDAKELNHDGTTDTTKRRER